ncbi:MAG: bifunctional riboflavin kinase/FAD synthetase [Chloroflexi bacterium]|nr:bifunctional riboflavin kinase/FAD synthetase [Ktedonobacteraceae bacterium]MBV9708685.1 bifunctional riboflavin kinase/FAD synthetase [Chloroflexota bacterium]
MEYTTNLSTNEPIIITIGNFDGVHRGHQCLLRELRATAQELHCKPVLVTFAPHTVAVLRPDIHLECLTTLEEKLVLAAQYTGIDNSIIIHFTQAIAAMSAQEFLDSLRTHFAIRGLVVGANFSLGHNRVGNIAFLQQYGEEHHMLVQTIAVAEDEHMRISSTRIRALVSEGRMSEANELLGHPMTMRGTITYGDQRGRQLGFPTANVQPEPNKLLPANGVYAVQAHIIEDIASNSDMCSVVYKGVANIGIRPTFNGKERVVEVHLLDVTLELYNKRLSIEFIARLRAEQRFSSVDALKAQIVYDVQQARQLLQEKI